MAIRQKIEGGKLTLTVATALNFRFKPTTEAGLEVNIGWMDIQHTLDEKGDPTGVFVTNTNNGNISVTGPEADTIFNAPMKKVDGTDCTLAAFLAELLYSRIASGLDATS